MLKKILIVVVVLVVIAGFGYMIVARAAVDPTQEDTNPLSVPVIVTPSLQIATGQVLLYKATNVSESPASFRLMLYTDDNGVPNVFKDFTRIGAGKTVNYVYKPPTATLTLDDASVEAPQAVRATFAPIPRTDPGAIRKIVANVQIMRIQNGAKGASSLDTPIVVPLSHCNFEPRGTIPYLEGLWYWNCAPDMYPLRRVAQTGSGGR